MYKGKIVLIIAVTFLMTLSGIFSVKAQDAVKEKGGNAEDNMARVDAIRTAQMNSDGQIRIVARLGIGENESSLSKKRLEAARSYLVETRGLESDKLNLEQGEKADGLGRLEFYLDDALIDIILAERGENTSFTCCGNDVPKPESKAKNTTRSKVETQIIALEKQAWEEWKNGNKKFIENFVADDVFYVYPEGVMNKSQIVEGVGSCKFNNYSLEDFKFKMLDKNSALISYTANQDIVCNGSPAPKKIRSTSVYVKRKGKWLSTFYTETAEVK